MSYFDISKIASYISSSKIKDRNDGLNLLEDLSISDVGLSSKQFNVIVSGIFCLVEHERILFVKNKNHVNETRLSRASSCLRQIVSKSIVSSERLDETPKSTIKYKAFLSVVGEIRRYFVVDKIILEPCAMDFAKVLSTILNSAYFREHLNSDEWQEIYDYACFVSILAMDFEGTFFKFDSLITELLISIKCLVLMNGSLHVFMLRPIYSQSGERNYKALAPLLSKVSKYIKKGNLLVVLFFRIMNLLFRQLSTEDRGFLSRAAVETLEIGVKIFPSQLEALNNEFFEFISLNSMHNILIDVFHPDKDYGNESSHTQENSDYLLEYNDATGASHMKDWHYNLGVLIQRLFSMVGTVDYKLEVDSFVIKNNITLPKSIFELTSIQLHYRSSIDRNAWMLLVGLSKLIKSYYDIKRLILDFELVDNHNDLSYSMQPETKRYRLDDVAYFLYLSNSCFELCFKLIDQKHDTEIHRKGFQLLIFLLESTEGLQTELIHPMRFKNSDLCESGNFRSSDLDISESSLLNAAFNTLENSDLNNLYEMIMEKLQIENIAFWAILALWALTVNTLDHLSSINVKCFNQLFNLIIPFLKGKVTCKLSCSLFYLLVTSLSILQLRLSIDRSTITQIENLIDLADLNGPSIICLESFRFWYAIAILSYRLCLNKAYLISTRAHNWFFSKWDTLVNDEIEQHLRDVIDCCAFILWLAGIRDFPNHETGLAYSFKHRDQFVFSRDELCFFITHEQLKVYRPIPENLDSINIPKVANGKDIVAELIGILQGARAQNYSKKLFVLYFMTWLVCLRLSELRNGDHLSTLDNELFLILDEIKLTSLKPHIKSFIALMDLSHVNLNKSLNRRLFEIFDLEDLQLILNEIYKDDSRPSKALKENKEREISAALQLLMLERETFPRNQRDSLGNIVGSARSLKTFFNFCATVSVSGDVFFETLCEYLKFCPNDSFLQLFNDLQVLFSQEVLKIENVCISFFKQLTRLVGEKPLTDIKYERSEMIQVNLCQYLQFLLPVWSKSEDEEFKKDFEDLATWILLCGSKDLVVTESALVAFMRLLSCFLRYGYNDFNGTNIGLLLLAQFERCSNYMRVAMSSFFDDFFKKLSIADQMSYYKEIYALYQRDLVSPEAYASCFIFLSLISKSSPQLAISVVFNLTELSKLTRFRPYINCCIKHLATRLNLPLPKSLFKTLRLDLLKSWFIYGYSLDDFPHEFFGFDNKVDFYSKNYAALLAIAYSSRGENTKWSKIESQITNLLRISRLRQSVDCLPLLIPLSYTTHGIRNDVFDILATKLGSSYKKYLTENLIFVVIETLRMMDVTDRPLIANLAKRKNVPPVLCLSDAPSHESAGQIVISFNSGVSLIENLIEKSSDQSFWTSNITYFIIRHLTDDLKGSLSVSQIQAVTWRIKTAIIFGYESMFFIEILNLFAFSLCPYLINSDVFDDILGIFDLFFSNPSFLRKYEVEMTPIVLYICLTYLESASHKSCPAANICKLVECFANTGIDSHVRHLLRSCVDALKGSKVTLSANDIELCLNELSHNSKFCSDQNMKMLIRFISALFNRVTVLRGIIPDRSIAHILMNVDENVFKLKTDKFAAWTARYLGEFYLHFPDGESVERNAEMDEINLDFLNDFQDNVLSLNSVLQYVALFLQSPHILASSYAEYLMGALLWKFKNTPEELKQIFSFHKFEESYRNIAVPLDFNQFFRLTLCDGSAHKIMGRDTADFILMTQGDLSSIPFEDWSASFCATLLHELEKMTDVATLLAIFSSSDPSFAPLNLPKIVIFYLGIGDRGAISTISQLYATFAKVNFPDYRWKRLILEILLSVRFGSIKKVKAFEDVYNSIDGRSFFPLAISCKMFRTALMLFEEEQKDYQETDLGICKPILSQIYEGIDEEDLYYGLPEETTLEYAFQRITKTSNSDDGLKISSAILDLKISSHSMTSNNNLIHCMLENGMLGVPKLIDSSSMHGENSDAFEWSWKLNSWELPDPGSTLGQHETIYRVLRHLSENDGSPNACTEGFIDLMKHRSNFSSGLHDKKLLRDQFKKWISTLACITSIEDACEYSDDNFKERALRFVTKTSWFLNSGLHYSENILLSRKAVFHILATSGRSSYLSPDNLKLCALNELTRYNTIARNCKMKQKMMSSIKNIDIIAKSDFSDTSHNMRHNIDCLAKYHVACTLWCSGQTEIPIEILKEIEMSGDVILPLEDLNIPLSVISSKLVDWIAKSHHDSATNIMEKHVLPSCEVLHSMKDLQQSSKVYASFANFCEAQYKSKVSSEQLSKLEKRVENKRREIEELKLHYSKMPVGPQEKKNAQKYYSKLKLHYMAENEDLNVLRQSLNNFSSKAVELYLKSVLLDEHSDESIDRFFALWLENSSISYPGIKNDILRLPSHCMISWCAQLISRLSDEDSLFQIIIRSLILNLAFDHPFHSLYNLISLRKYESLALKNADEVLLSKIKISNTLWDSLVARRGIHISEILGETEDFSNQAIALAEKKVGRGKDIDLSKVKYGYFWMNELPKIPPPSLSIPVDFTKSYKDVPMMIKVDPVVKIATSGLSLPKILTFILSNGKVHKVLLKSGTDDLRQDSIMEQVFEKVNKMLSKDEDTRGRNLRVRTYKAVPLGPEAGIIEFVPNSIAFIEAIKPYHTTFDTIGVDKAREQMKKCQNSEKRERVKVYNQITKKIKPVLRLFFFDRFPRPNEWFNSRMCYARGVAATSILGHILGLGDRHCNNILLDQHTGEPIHIDLGVSFDQGKQLPIPETVPFRLTRDIVDGFGITGVRGVFVKSCEHTYRVLRNNKDHILAILDVLRWDPLYSWTLSPLKRRKLQDGEVNEVSKLKLHEDGSEGGRAVGLVAEKLIAEGLSIEALVRELIQEASNPNNLALIYCGWCPFF